MASPSTVSTRMSAGASRWASSRSTNRCGTSAAASTRSSWLAAVCIERRRANGLRASRVMRLLADRMPITAPSPSSTGTWFTPADIMAMLASGASTWAPIVWTGVVMMRRDRRLARHAGEHHLVAKVDVGDDPQAVAQPHQKGAASRPRRSASWRPRGWACRARRTAARCAPATVTGRLRTSGRDAHGARRLDQALALVAGQPHQPFGVAQQVDRHVFGDAVEDRAASRARVVNSGGRPVSSVGWPKTSPRVIRATTASLCTSSSVPSRTT